MSTITFNLNHKPTTLFQPRAKDEPINPTFLEAAKEATASDLLELAPWGEFVYFSCPLQRRADFASEGFDRFWWEPSGGRNQNLFQGFITGVRTLSTGEREHCQYLQPPYVPSASFPVFLITFSPHHNPVYVLPWHIWLDEESLLDAMPSP